MATQTATSQEHHNSVVDWAQCVPKSVDSADTMAASKVPAVWEALYREARFGSGNESKKRAFRAGVYTYGLLNGTSREGSYQGDIVLADGTVVAASIIPTVVGKMQIRQFYRANMVESYSFLKTSKVAESHPRFLAKAAAHSIAADDAFAVADWLKDCPKFTPSESKAHDAYFQYSVDRAKRARGGETLERVEDQRIKRGLSAQGPGESEGTQVTF